MVILEDLQRTEAKVAECVDSTTINSALRIFGLNGGVTMLEKKLKEVSFVVFHKSGRGHSKDVLAR